MELKNLRLVFRRFQHEIIEQIHGHTGHGTRGTLCFRTPILNPLPIVFVGVNGAFGFCLQSVHYYCSPTGHATSNDTAAGDHPVVAAWVPGEVRQSNLSIDDDDDDDDDGDRAGGEGLVYEHEEE